MPFEALAGFPGWCLRDSEGSPLVDGTLSSETRRVFRESTALFVVLPTVHTTAKGHSIAVPKPSMTHPLRIATVV